MKQLFAVLLMFGTLVAQSQKAPLLKQASAGDSLASDKAIIYGCFIQRLGFSSGGFPQDIRLLNVESGKIWSLRVKPTFKSARENSFCAYIQPGQYAILNYWWTESKWYGGQMHTETIYKTGNRADAQYAFVVAPGSLNYLGTWHFDKEPVSFSSNKDSLDSELTKKFPLLRFLTSNVAIPQ